MSFISFHSLISTKRLTCYICRISYYTTRVKMLAIVKLVHAQIMKDIFNKLQKISYN